MGIKLIAMDMDGTLLRKDNTISERTKQVLCKVQEKGVRLVLASGRSYRKLMEYAKELNMEKYGGYLIEVNGIARYNLETKERKVFHQLHHEQMVEIFTCLQSLGLELIGMSDDAMYDYIPDALLEEKRMYRKSQNLGEDYPLTAGTFTFIFDNRVGYPHQHTIHDASDFPDALNKMIVSHHPHVLNAYIPKIKELLEDRYWIGLTAPGWLEIMPKGVTKGSGIQELAQALDISLDEVMAFGDGENDIEMLEVVGYGVAMGNALPDVFAHANHICADHEHDGIAETIESIILSK